MIFTIGFLLMFLSFAIWYKIGMPVGTKAAKLLRFTADVGVITMMISVWLAIWKYMP